jgi:glycosyltransferase involved in cell wall biosynthesis
MLPRVSLTMIVKDEESNLPTCLASVDDLVDEIVIVDTGSSDRTREVARGFGALVHEFAWVDDFSAARNESLRHASGRWIFWLDGDEWLDEENRHRLRSLFASLGDENDGYIMQQLCIKQSSLNTETVVGDKIVEQVRLFRNHPEIRWDHRVYEQIVGGVRRAGGDLRPTDVVIQHPGYQDPGLHRRKIERNMRLAQLELLDRPDNPYVLYTIGVFHQMLGNVAETLPYFQRSMKYLWTGATYSPKLFCLLAQSLHQMSYAHDALAVCRAGRDRYRENEELRHQEELLQRTAADRTGAEYFLFRLLQVERGRYSADVGRDVRKHARHNLAMIYRQERRAADAEAQWNAALAESPEFSLGWLELGELFLASGRFAALEKVVAHLEGTLHQSEDATVLWARALMAQGEFARARSLLEPVIAQAPQAVRPRLVLSQCFLFEGRDWLAGRQALLDVLAIDPHNEQALYNLSVHQKRRPATAARPGSDPQL